ncbi:L-histidine N(alpha)-methyltransferase [Pontibacter silvestris]|uniref:L-histidine N(Alpha)-methyltransferase n=1 Tax=Pontibacter silvestris TaxID=2305183 RepID=A0ABW4WYE3_9BACT|nr:L-histidine N(alpha)-methyltransferase [Pontibacter silvestris]MCC9138484.1 L-histidine N(alpha)-methyltransferase [Pontibacter silvestris]
MNSTNCPVDALAQTDTLLEKFCKEVLEGLQSKPKRLQSKYFYDKEGDRLFQQIMACPEYYLTDCEEEIFRNKTKELASIITSHSSPFDLIELGAGDATKSQYLLQYLADTQETFTYMPIDISGNILSILESRLKREINGLNIRSLEGEYFDMLGRAAELSHRRKVVLFLGANIGNMEPQAANAFCRELRARLKPGDLVLMGFDLKKHPKLILDAYSDRAGITSRFNLNLLERINRELDGEFNLDQFEHYQSYDPLTGACRSYLVSKTDQEVLVAGQPIDFRQDEIISMEISQKYDPEEITSMAKQADFMPIGYLTDSRNWFLDTFWQCVDSY